MKKTGIILCISYFLIGLLFSVCMFYEMYIQYDRIIGYIDILAVSYFFFFSASLLYFIPMLYKRFCPEIIYKENEKLLNGCFSNGSRASLLFADGYSYWHDENYVMAINIFEKVSLCSISERELAALNFFIGHCYEMTDYPEKSLRHYEKALSMGVNSADLIRRLIRMLIICGNFERAKQLLDYYDTPDIDESLKRSFNWNYAMYYLALGETEAALEYLEKEPEYPSSSRVGRLLWSRIYALLSLNRGEEAAEIKDRLISAYKMDENKTNERFSALCRTWRVTVIEEEANAE